MKRLNENQKKEIIQENLEPQRKLYDTVLDFIESNSEEEEIIYADLIKIITEYEILNKLEELKHFLCLLLNISNNHHREANFFKKIERILENTFNHLQQNSKQTLSNFEIFEIFKSNKLIILFLLKKQIIKFNGFIIDEILNYQKELIPKYCHFFINEINEFIKNNEYFSYLKEKIIEIELEIKELDINFPNQYEEKRLIGENDSYICSLIRNDLVEDFIAYVTRENIKLSSLIKPSIYETNIFLLRKEKTSLIEYAIFYGSIKILKYLYFNKVEINENLWEYGIHSNNPNIIHYLEELFKNNDNQLNIFLESIKCHHNGIAEYIKDNILNISEEELNTNENIISTSFKHCNYKYFPTTFDNNFSFFYLYQYKYSTIIKIIFQIVKKKIKPSKLNKLKILHELKNESSSEIEIQEALKNLFSIYFMLKKEKQINEKYFKNCFQLEEIIIPPKIKSIKMNAFFGCQSLTQISIPSSVTLIFQNAFRNCTKLKQIIIPSSVTSIEKNAFDGCTSLTEITIPTSVKFIGSGVFYGCTSLKNISLPSSIDKIESHLFFGCSSLSKIFIPSSVTSIGESSFKECSTLKRVIFEIVLFMIFIIRFIGLFIIIKTFIIIWFLIIIQLV